MRRVILGVALVGFAGACDSVNVSTSAFELPDAGMSQAGAGGSGGGDTVGSGGVGGEVGGANAGGVGGTDAGGTAGAAGSGATSCGSNDDCPIGVCQVEQGICVECLVNATCDVLDRCRHNVCEPRVTCGGAVPCPTKYPYCNFQRLECEECVTSQQCGADQECTANSVCAPLPTCANDDDCEDTRYCNLGKCVRHACTPGQRSCPTENKLMECNADGHTLTELDCRCKAGSSACLPRVCNLGASFCQNNQAMHCVDDGYALEPEDCFALGLACIDGECQAP